ncbi:hypothetical protein HDV05_003821 [Chytridiales sp. JEL 0842]|nr:hypothetical protein HDV05_003821 [Chytridiales sp. JEL 0842]
MAPQDEREHHLKLKVQPTIKISKPFSSTSTDNLSSSSTELQSKINELRAELSRRGSQSSTISFDPSRLRNTLSTTSGLRNSLDSAHTTDYSSTPQTKLLKRLFERENATPPFSITPRRSSVDSTELPTRVSNKKSGSIDLPSSASPFRVNSSSTSSRVKENTKSFSGSVYRNPKKKTDRISNLRVSASTSGSTGVLGSGTQVSLEGSRGMLATRSSDLGLGVKAMSTTAAGIPDAPKSSLTSFQMRGGAGINHPPPPRAEPPVSLWTHFQNFIKSLNTFTIYAQNPFYTRWFHVITALHILRTLTAPLLLGWSEVFYNSATFYVFILIDIFMLLDCFFQSRLAYEDEYGTLVVERGKMLKRWMYKQNGILQGLASVPVEVFAFTATKVLVEFSSDPIPEYISPLSYYRQEVWAIMVMTKVLLRTPFWQFQRFKVPYVALPISHLIKTITILLFLAHIDTCAFWFVERILESNGKRWIDKKHLIGPKVTFSTQYLTSYLYALKALVLKFRAVYLNTENVFSIFECVAGILAYGTIFGNLHAIVDMLDSSAETAQADLQHKFHMENVKQFMLEKQIRPELQKVVQEYKEIHWQRLKGTDEASLFDTVPKSVQQEIKNFLYLDLVKKVPIFQGTDAHFQNHITFKIKPVVVLDQGIIFHQGDEASDMYFIQNGHIEILDSQNNVLVTLSPGSFFGEIALFECTRRTASARAKGTAELCILNKDDFEHIMNTYPEVAELIRESVRRRKEDGERRKAEAEAARLKAELEEEEKKRKANGSRFSLSRSGLRFRHSMRSLMSSTKSKSRFGLFRDGNGKGVPDEQDGMEKGLERGSVDAHLEELEEEEDDEEEVKYDMKRRPTT